VHRPEKRKGHDAPFVAPSPASLQAGAANIPAPFDLRKRGQRFVAGEFCGCLRPGFRSAVAVNDPARAIGLALALDDFPARSEALRRVATALSNADPRPALVQ
jgi:hypothetical protein